MKIEVYAFEDAQGNEQSFTTQDPNEARQYATEHKFKWLARIFEYADTELVEDFTGGDEDHTARAPEDNQEHA